MLATYHRGSDGGIVRACAIGAPSEHKEGRAWDWMLDVRDPHSPFDGCPLDQFAQRIQQRVEPRVADAELHDVVDDVHVQDDEVGTLREQSVY